MTSFYAVSMLPAPEAENLASSGAEQEFLEPQQRVFQTKEDALKCLRKMKKCRYKQFDTFEEALEFASQLLPDTTDQTDGKPQSPNPTDVPYKSLTPQQLKQLKV